MALLKPNSFGRASAPPPAQQQMARYFFDLVKEKLTAHDHQGRYFQLPEQARRQGELIAIDLQFASDSWAGGQVLVRDVKGRALYSIPVPAEE